MARGLLCNGVEDGHFKRWIGYRGGVYHHAIGGKKFTIAQTFKTVSERLEMSVDTREATSGTGFKFPISTPSATDLAKKIELTYDRMGYRSLKEVYCETDENNNITLRGNTATFYLKQVAQVIASKVAGVGLIKNQIRVAG